MFNMHKFNPIFELIDEYATFKYQRHPMIAHAQRALLIRFARDRKIRRVEDITEDHIASYVGGELSEYYGMVALKALRQFLWYSRASGHDCIAHNTASRVKLQRQQMENKVDTKYEPKEMPAWVKPKWGSRWVAP